MARLGLGKLPEWVRRLDEFIFNHNGQALENYQGAKHMLSLSILSAILSASILAGIGKFSPGYFCFAIGIFNEIFHIDHVFALPGFFRKFFYPFFVAIITSIFLLAIVLTIYMAYLGIMIMLGIVIICVFVKVVIGGDMQTNVSTPSMSVPGKSTNSNAETAVIDNSVTVTKTDEHLNIWEGSNGGYYRRNSDGSFTKNN